MIRYACRCDTLIIGAATKLFSYFCKNYEFKSIVTFSDNRLFEGKLYEKLGFTFSHETSPNYWYTTGENKISRISAQKHKLKDLLGEENFNDSLSEKDNMLLNGYRIVYDAGNKVFIFNK